MVLLQCMGQTTGRRKYELIFYQLQIIQYEIKVRLFLVWKCVNILRGPSKCVLCVTKIWDVNIGI
jgi:hypothetical protein